MDDYYWITEGERSYTLSRGDATFIVDASRRGPVSCNCHGFTALAKCRHVAIINKFRASEHRHVSEHIAKEIAAQIEARIMRNLPRSATTPSVALDLRLNTDRRVVSMTLTLTSPDLSHAELAGFVEGLPVTLKLTT